MTLTDEQLERYIAKAIEHGACESTIDILNTLNAQDVLEHESAPYWAHWYAIEVIEGRWVEAEDIIKTDVEASYLYAKHVIKGRWVKGEDAIKTDAYYSYRYARNVIGGRWAEGEGAIKTNPCYFIKYSKFIGADA